MVSAASDSGWIVDEDEGEASGSWARELTIGAVVVGVVGFAITLGLPPTYHAQRAATFKVKRDAIHAISGDLTRWAAWTEVWPSEPTPTVAAISEQTSAKGARASWSGPTGAGELVFQKCSLEEGVAYERHFPGRREVGRIEYQVGLDNAVLVTWVVEGEIEGGMFSGLRARIVERGLETRMEGDLRRLRAKVEPGWSILGGGS